MKANPAEKAPPADCAPAGGGAALLTLDILLAAEELGACEPPKDPLIRVARGTSPARILL